MPTTQNPIGVFTNSTGTNDPVQAMEIVKKLGLNTIQVGELEERWYKPAGVKEFKQLLAKYRIAPASVVIIFAGERYDDFDAVLHTVGYRPKELLAQRLDFSRRVVEFAAALGSPFVTTHMGVLPRDEKDPLHRQLVGAVREVAAACAKHGRTLSLETGQETGEELMGFIDRLAGLPIKINFDTANLLLYNMDDSPGALRVMLPRVTSVHVKDGCRPTKPGALGEEQRLGEGKARVAECLRLLHDANWRGPLIIENFVWAARKTDPFDELRRSKEFIEANWPK